MNDLGIIEDGSVLIRNDYIAAVGPTRRLENLREAREAAVISANGRIVIPGFVDPSLRLMTGSTLRAVRQRNLNLMAQEASGVLRSALQHGTTRAEVKIGGSSALDELRALKSAARMDVSGEEFVRTWLARPLAGENGTDVVAARQPHFEYVSKKMRSSFFEVEATPGAETAAADLLTAAAACRLPSKLAWNGSPERVLFELLSTFTLHTLSGLDRLVTPLMDTLSASQTTLLLTAGEKLLRADRLSGVREFVDAGGGIALASGYDPVQSPAFNMQMAIALAVSRMRLTPEEAITAATVNAAHASGILRKAGTLEAGKQADLVILNLANYRDLPRQFGINHVGLVLRAGNVVFNRIGWKPPRTA
jgi:imidazolonepropionase